MLRPYGLRNLSTFSKSDWRHDRWYVGLEGPVLGEGHREERSMRPSQSFPLDVPFGTQSSHPSYCYTLLKELDGSISEDVPTCFSGEDVRRSKHNPTFNMYVH